MLRPDDRSLCSRLLIPLALLASLLLHVGLLLTVGGQSTPHEAPPRQIEFEVAEAPPPEPIAALEPEPETDPEPEPEPLPEPEPEPEPILDFREPELVEEVPEPAPDLPASNQTEPVEESDKPVQPVFGVTPDSVDEGAEGDFAVPIGNTLMKPPDETYTPPEEVQPYVQPERAPFRPTELVEVTHFPSVRRQVTPRYPPDLRAAGREGTVIVEADIDAEGRVIDARIKQPTGTAFDDAALEAIRETRYNPARQGDRAVAVRVSVPVRFRLR